MAEYRDFLFRSYFRTCCDSLPTELRDEFIITLITYGTEGTLIKSSPYITGLMNSIIPNIDKSCERFRRASIGGQKGGRPRRISRSPVINLYKLHWTQAAIAKQLAISRKSVQRIICDWKLLAVGPNAIEDNESAPE
ncbi:MAG: helix-turn-helix domain-containing protein [Eubacteriales bacterium]